MKIGNSIKTIRIQRGFSQVELAEKTGLAQNVISRIERNAHQPNDATLDKLAKALDVENDVFYYLALIELGSKSDNPKKIKIAEILRNEVINLFKLNQDI